MKRASLIGAGLCFCGWLVGGSWGVRRFAVTAKATANHRGLKPRFLQKGMRPEAEASGYLEATAAASDNSNGKVA